MNTVTSKDGTTIAYDKTGTGPLLVWVTGALGYRQHFMSQALAEALASHFTVINYDRRGRGDSGDTLPYAPEREIEDIEALIDANGGSAMLVGMSSGAALALRAARQLGSKVQKAALYEPPFITDDSRPPLPADYVQRINSAIASGDRSAAVELFMREGIRIPEEYIAPMKADPSWADMEKVAHTLAYDGEILDGISNGKPVEPEVWKDVTMPVTVIVGGNSEPFFHSGGEAIADALPQGTYRSLPGQDHAVDPAALAPLVAECLA